MHFAAQFRAQSGEDALAQPRAAVRLRQACERLRRTLSANSQSSVAIDCLVGEAGLQCSLTRAELEAMAEPLLARVGAACAQAMSDSGLRPGDLHSVELVGGFSRMPAVQGVLQEVRSPPPLPPSSPCGLAPPLCPAASPRVPARGEYMRTARRFHCPAIAVCAQALGVEPSRTLNAEESVARGAALAAALQSPSFKVRPLLLQEGLRQPYTVHWRADDGGPPSGSLELELGSPLPLTRRLTLHTNAALRVSCEQAACGGRQLEQLAPGARPRGRSSRWAVWKDEGDEPTRTVHVDVIVDANQLPSLRASEPANAEEEATGSAAGSAAEGAPEGTEEDATEGAAQGAEAGAVEGAVEGAAEGAAAGAAEGAEEGVVEGAEGAEEGAEDDVEEGTAEGPAEASAEGAGEGAGEGEGVAAEPPAAKMAPPDEALQLDEASSFGLPAESLEALRAEEEEMRRVDAHVEAKLHAKNELEACVYRTRSVAAEYVANGLVPEDEGAAMRARLAALEEWLDVQRGGLRRRPVLACPFPCANNHRPKPTGPTRVPTHHAHAPAVLY